MLDIFNVSLVNLIVLARRCGCTVGGLVVGTLASIEERCIIILVRLVELMDVFLNTGVEEMVNKYINICESGNNKCV